MKKKSLGSKLITSPYIVWSAIFIVVPLIIMVYFALTDANGVFTWANLAQIGKYKKAFGLSILYAAIATVITLFLAYPMAYFMTKLKISSQRMLMLIVMLPMWMNFLIRTYSWVTILSNTGLINTFLKSIGLDPIQLMYTPGAIILGMVYDFIPYMILPIYSVMSKLDNSLLEAAEDLGSNAFTKFRRVILPLTRPGIISGITSWGIYVELPNTVEGMIRTSLLTDDFYAYDEKNMELKGTHSGKVYRLGEPVKVLVNSTDEVLRTIDFLLYDEDEV